MTPEEKKFVGDLSNHLASRRLRETAEEQEVKYKKLLLDDLLQVGDETPEGHFVYEFDPEEPNLQFPGDRAVLSVKREKRTSTRLDPDVVEQLLPAEYHDKVFTSTVTVTGLSPGMVAAVMDALADFGLAEPEQVTEETVLDEDELLALNYNDEVSDDDLKKMYVEGKVIYALKVNYAKAS